MARRNSYRLAPTPSAVFRELFDKAELYFGPAQERANPEWKEVAFVDIPSLDRSADSPSRSPTEEFGVWMPASNGRVAEQTMAKARSVMDQIAELDAAAREAVRNNPNDDDEHLAYVQIGGCEIVLHFYAKAWNNEWPVHFIAGAPGNWVVHPDPPKRWYPE